MADFLQDFVNYFHEEYFGFSVVCLKQFIFQHIDDCKGFSVTLH